MYHSGLPSDSVSERRLLAQSGRSSSLTEHKRDLQLICNLLISWGIKTRSFTPKSLKRRHKHETLNHRVPGSSPGAPTRLSSTWQ